jgi:hypothetical protein
MINIMKKIYLFLFLPFFLSGLCVSEEWRCSGKLNVSFGDDYSYSYSDYKISGSSFYSLCISDESAYKGNETGKGYLKEGSVVKITYTPATLDWFNYHGGGATGGPSADHYGGNSTRLLINDERINVSKTYTVTGDMHIQLLKYGYQGEWGKSFPTKEGTIFDLNLICDGDVPQLKIEMQTSDNSDYVDGSWTTENVTFKLSGSDASGLKGYLVSTDGGINWSDVTDVLPAPFIKQAAYTVSTEGIYAFCFRAVDNFGDTSELQSRIVKIDRTPPSIKFNAEGYEAGTWVQNPVTVRVHAEDANKVESLVLYADDIVSTGLLSVAAGNAEIYEVSAAAVDESGKRSSKIFGSVKLDRKAPVIGTVGLAFEAPADGKLMQYLDAESAVSDAGVNSGLAEITVQYKIGSGRFVPVEHTDLSPASVYDCRCRIPLDGIDRSSDKTVYVQFTAEDAAGNSSVRTASILLPAAMHASAGTADSRVDGSLIKTKITLGAISPGSYGAVRYRRTFLAGSVEITEDNFDTFFQESERSVWRNLTGMQTLHESQLVSSENDGVRTYYYEDTIAADSGFGHKNIRYTFYETPPNCSFTEYNGGPAAFLLADNKGIITWKITGRGGKELILGADGSESHRDKDFVLPSNGMVQISFRVQDYDMEPYRLMLKQVTGIDSGNGGTYLLRQQLEGAVSAGATGGCTGSSGSADEDGLRLYSDEAAASGDGWVLFKEPVYLTYNKPSCFILTASEGYAGSEYENETAVIKLTAAAPDLGGFTLSVSTGADYRSGGITVRPYQAAALEIEPVSAERTGTLYGWNFGDGSTADGLSVSHAFKQDSARTGDTSTYSMQITRNGSAAALIPVHVVDSRYGTLYGNETWVGRHVLLGTVVIPDGMTLTIGDGREIEGTDVLCCSGADMNPLIGIRVKGGGKLIINNGSKPVTVTEAENTGADGFRSADELVYGWGALYLEAGAEASITNSLIQYADQGLEVCQGASLNIKDCILRGNRTGLHIFGGASAVLNDCTVTGNLVYGIKEDRTDNDSKITITINTATIISGNEADYYKWDTGVLTAEEIENKKAAER